MINGLLGENRHLNWYLDDTISEVLEPFCPYFAILAWFPCISCIIDCQKSVNCVKTTNLCGPIFLVVKLESKWVYKVQIFCYFNAADLVCVDLKKVVFDLYSTLIKTAIFFFFHQNINSDVYFHLVVHLLSKIIVIGCD
jgi:hypothetical protein